MVRPARRLSVDVDESGISNPGPSSYSSAKLFHRRQLLNHGRDESLVQVSLYKVQHGTLNSGKSGSIIVTDFRFESTGRSRIATAAINYTFRANPRLDVVDDKPSTRHRPYDNLYKDNKNDDGDGDDGDDGDYDNDDDDDDDDDNDEPGRLVVSKIAPSGYSSITARVAQLTTSVGVLSVDDSPGSRTANKRQVERDNVVPEQSTVAGSMRSRYREKDTARWLLTESEDERSGVPKYLKTAILVEHPDKESKLLATIEVSITLEGASKSRKVFASSAENTVIFDPIQDKGSNREKVESFGGTRLDERQWDEAVALTLAADLGDEKDSRIPIPMPTSSDLGF